MSDEMQNGGARASRGTWLPGCFAGCLISVVLIFGFVALSFYSLGKVFTETISLTDSSQFGLDSEVPVDESPLIKEVWSAGVKDGTKIVRISIKGVISLDESDNLFGPEEDSALFALESIRAATRDESVAAILLEIDSPGGGVTDSDIINDAIRRFRQSREGRYVFVHVGSLCASGGYYIAAAADAIMAHPTSIIGSIGVIMPGMNLRGLADRIGVKEAPIVSGKNKSMGGVLGDRTEEQTAILQSIVDNSYERFVKLVADGRNLDIENVKKLADGRLYTAEQALDAKLIDYTGYSKEALEMLCGNAKIEKPYVVRYSSDSPFSELRNFGRIFGASIIKGLNLSASPRLEYRCDQ